MGRWFVGRAAGVVWTDGDDRACLRAFGLLGLVLAVDDGLMLHEVVLAAVTGTTAFEPLVFAAYGSIAGWLAWRFLPALASTAIVFGAISAVLLGTSGIVEGTGLGSAFMEDGFKFAGIAAWTGCTVTQAGQAVRQQRAFAPIDRPAEGDVDRQHGGAGSRRN